MSPGHAIALQPGRQSETLSQKKKKVIELVIKTGEIMMFPNKCLEEMVKLKTEPFEPRE